MAALTFIFVLASFIFLILFLRRNNRRKRTNKLKLPSGEMGLPWIGETIEFYNAQRTNLLFENLFRPRIAKYGKVSKTRLMGSPTVVVHGAAANKFFMSNEFKLVVSSWPTSSVELMGKNSIMEKQGESHRCLRGIVTSTLTHSGLQAMVPRMCTSIQKHLHKNFEDVKKMEYTWQVARETMRLCPPIFGSYRKAITDIEFEGHLIPKGWKVLWTTYGTHYDEECFPDPMSFNPSRFADPVQAYSFIPFGGGPRLCAGYQLAKLNILVLIHYVATQYNWSLVYPDEPIFMDPLPFPSKGMPIKISPKSH